MVEMCGGVVWGGEEWENRIWKGGRPGKTVRGWKNWGQDTFVSGASSMAKCPSSSRLSVSAPAFSSRRAVSPWPSAMARLSYQRHHQHRNLFGCRGDFCHHQASFPWGTMARRGEERREIYRDVVPCNPTCPSCSAAICSLAAASPSARSRPPPRGVAPFGLDYLSRVPRLGA